MPGQDERVVLHVPSAAACHEHAQQLLKARGHEVKEVVMVDRDSILFIAPDGSPKTAWLRHFTVSQTGAAMSAVSGNSVPAHPDTPTVQVAVTVEDGFGI